MSDCVPWGGFDFWLYRISVAVASVLWVNFFHLQELSRDLYTGLNLLLHVVSVALHEIFIYIFDTVDGRECVGTRPIRMPQYDSFSAAFFLTMTMAHGLQFTSHRQYGIYRVAHALTGIVITPFGITPLLVFNYGESLASALLGAIVGILTFEWMALVLVRLEDVYKLEKRAELLRATSS